MSEITPLRIASPQTPPPAFLLVGCFEGEAPAVVQLPPATGEAVTRLAGRHGFSGREGQSAESLVGAEGATVALRGLGKRGELDAIKLRNWLDKAAEAARANGHDTLGLALPAHDATTGEAAAERIERQLMTAAYRFDRYLGNDRERDQKVAAAALFPPPGEEAAYAAALPVAQAVARAVVLARDLGNTPANEATPQWMEERAAQLAGERGMRMRTLGIGELSERGMGGILAVGKGSENPPRLVRLEFGEEGPVVALVGKGITFDTGGLSLKTAASMEDMKYDKCGACTALAVAAAVSELGLPIRLRTYLPLAENMPDGRSYRPGDIVTCYNGKTVEIVNTDAEGRMVLADALAWAVEEEADALLEFSTLTGACVIALGRDAAGLYSPHDGLAGELLAAAGRTAERLWRMPLWPEFTEAMKGRHADLKNAGERWGSANCAAAFLAEFVGPFERWAHLDIAGPANQSNNGPGATGATGYGIPFTVDWLRRLAAS